MNPLSEKEQQLMAAIQDGLPLTSRPYLALAQQLMMSEQEVINTVSNWLQSGLVKRLGLVVNHHRVGYSHNAMVVWDIPDDIVDNIGKRISDSGLVNLCYRRPRRLPDWPYNLFCMIHGRSRAEANDTLAQLVSHCGLEDFSHDLLFSTRQLKQCGGHYGKATPMNKEHLDKELSNTHSLDRAMKNC